MLPPVLYHKYKCVDSVPLQPQSYNEPLCNEQYTTETTRSWKMIRYEEENEKLKDQSRCAGARADLKMCLLESDCCKIHKRTPRECLNATDGTVPTECHALRVSFFECKRSLLDGRRRFRGPKGY